LKIDDAVAGDMTIYEAITKIRGNEELRETSYLS
jgi:hypothetical protein